MDYDDLIRNDDCWYCFMMVFYDVLVLVYDFNDDVYIEYIL